MTPRQLDAFGTILPEMIGTYDIVHIRVIVTAVVSGDPTVLIKNLISMLSMRAPCSDMVD
jgi:hypothetical protein